MARERERERDPPVLQLETRVLSRQVYKNEI
jgi:hypothetical protein